MRLPASSMPWGDVDGDGACDLVVMSRHEARLDARYESPSCVVSGKSGSVLHLIPFRADPGQDLSFNDKLPFSIGDLDGDGVTDLALAHVVRAQFLSLSKLVRIGTEWGDLGSGTIRRIVDCGDLNGDKVADFATLSRGKGFDSYETLRVLTIKDATCLYTLSAEQMLAWAGAGAGSKIPTLNVCSAGDVDSDGRNELAVALPDTGFVAMISTRKSEPLWTTRMTTADGAKPSDFIYGFGDELRIVGDLDKDGHPDLAVGGCSASTSVPYETACIGVRIHSSMLGQRLMTITPRPGLEPKVEVTMQPKPTEKRR